MEETEVTEYLPRLELPEAVTLGTDEIAFTPRELKLIRKASGRSWTQIMADEDDDEKFTVLAWLKLRREGFELEYTEMEDVVIKISGEEQANPTSEKRPTSWPSSVGDGE